MKRKRINAVHNLKSIYHNENATYLLVQDILLLKGFPQMNFKFYVYHSSIFCAILLKTLKITERILQCTYIEV